MKFLHVKQMLVALEDFPKKPSVFVDRLSWFVVGVFIGLLIAHLFIK